jgi:hypothetical protein
MVVCGPAPARASCRPGVIFAALVFLLCGGLLGTAPAAAAPSKRASLERAAAPAERALERARTLAMDSRPAGERELTPILQELGARYAALDGEHRRAARALLARPTDGAADPAANGYAVPEETPYCTLRFCFHWVATTEDAPDLASADGDAVPDYVQQVAGVLEQVDAKETGPADVGLAWPRPPGDGVLGEPPGSGTVGRTDVYLSNLGLNLFGYVAADPQQTVPQRYSYIVLDNDYASPDYGGLPPLDSLRVTAAHEYNHVLQYGYDAFADLWMMEATATWAEDVVYDDVNDYYRFVQEWATRTERPLTSLGKMYGSVVWNQWLAERYGPELVRAAWERSRSVAPPSYAPAAYDGALREAGGESLAGAFARFSTAVAEWGTAGSAFPEGSSYAEVERVGSLSASGPPVNVELDHLTFALLDVPPTGAGALRLTATIPSGTSGAIGLVGRTGPSPIAGTTISRLRELPTGGTGTVTLTDPSRFGRITAVLVNADASQAGYGTHDWFYTKDDQVVSASLESLEAAAPENDLPPVVSGLAVEGSVLSGGRGEWAGSEPMSFDYVWLRCDPGAGCEPIAGAQSESYRADAADVGHSLRLRVTATNGAGSIAAESVPVGPVVVAAAVGTVPPGIQPTDAPFGTAVTAPSPGPPSQGQGPLAAGLRATASVKRHQRLREALKRGLVLKVSCDRPCTIRAELQLDRRTARRLRIAAPRRRVVVARGRMTLPASNAAASLALRFTRSKLPGLRRARTLRARLVTRVSTERDQPVLLTESLTLSR